MSKLASCSVLCKGISVSDHKKSKGLVLSEFVIDFVSADAALLSFETIKCAAKIIACATSLTLLAIHVNIIPENLTHFSQPRT